MVPKSPQGDAVSMARHCGPESSVGLWSTQWCLPEAGRAARSLLAGLADQLLLEPTRSPTGPCGPGCCGLAHLKEVVRVQGGLLLGTQHLSSGTSLAGKPWRPGGGLQGERERAQILTAPPSLSPLLLGSQQEVSVHCQCQQCSTPSPGGQRMS